PVGPGPLSGLVEADERLRRGRLAGPGAAVDVLLGDDLFSWGGVYSRAGAKARQTNRAYSRGSAGRVAGCGGRAEGGVRQMRIADCGVKASGTAKHWQDTSATRRGGSIWRAGM